MKTFYLLICAVPWLAPPGTSHASIVMTIMQTGPDVVATATGSANITGLTFGAGFSDTGLFPSVGNAVIGPTGSVSTAFYGSISGPTSFGTGSFVPGSSGSGNRLGFSRSLNNLVLPAGYVSGTALSSAATWSGRTLAGMGLTPGTYTYTWGSGPNADSLQLNIVPAGVPEPNALMLSGIALVAGWSVRRFRLRKIASAEALPEN